MVIIWLMMVNHNLVGGIPTPLKNDGIRQLGWWNSQYMEKACSKPPTRWDIWTILWDILHGYIVEYYETLRDITISLWDIISDQLSWLYYGKEWNGDLMGISWEKTLWMFNISYIALEDGSFIDDKHDELPIKFHSNLK